jgi:DNA uptake protein ComE-like DNA-binding protein
MTTQTIRAAALLAVLSAPGLALAEHGINVNTASQEEIMKLPEMNEARAKAILNYRATQGELIQLEELELVPQVKPIFPKIKDHLVLE